MLQPAHGRLLFDESLNVPAPELQRGVVSGFISRRGGAVEVLGR